MKSVVHDDVASQPGPKGGMMGICAHFGIYVPKMKLRFSGLVKVPLCLSPMIYKQDLMEACKQKSGVQGLIYALIAHYLNKIRAAFQGSCP
jgi:hypothetical protein